MAKIELKKKGKVLYITLNRPEAMNAVDSDMMSALDTLWEDFEGDPDVWVGILTGAGGHFCSGYDIKLIQSRQEQGEQFTESTYWERNSFPDGHNVTKPLIAALDGNVNGLGVWLALQSDVRIATERTVFGLGEARFNFPVVFSAFVSKYLPRAIAVEMLFALKRFNARRLYELGIVNEVVPEDHLMITAEKAASILVECGPLSLRTMKELLNFDPSHEERLRITAEKIVPVVNSDDTKEAVKAFLERRKPTWTLR
jgi:enoyl-CoA hydratase/carnithine racemase